jgi:hypothetical protein
MVTDWRLVGFVWIQNVPSKTETKWLAYKETADRDGNKEIKKGGNAGRDPRDL